MEMTKKDERKIGKLLELLNEYEKEIGKSEFYEWEKGIGGDTNLFRRNTRDEEGSHLYSDTADIYVISKKYGFIKWLVENDKIDYGTRNPLCITEIVGEKEKQIPYSFYEEMLIRLALSDTPIEDLINYLK